MVLPLDTRLDERNLFAPDLLWYRQGLPELWLVDSAAEEVLVFRRSTPRAERFDLALELGTGDVLESPLLPGFSLAVADLYPK